MKIRFIIFLRSMSGTKAPSSTRAFGAVSRGACTLGATKAEAVAARAASTAVLRDGAFFLVVVDNVQFVRQPCLPPVLAAFHIVVIKLKTL